MPRNRFVVPETVKLPLSEGDWIEVKRELNVGERKQLEAAGVKHNMFTPPEVNWAEYHIARVGIWLTDWSFRDVNDKPKPLSLDAVKSLDEETFEEIQKALDEHIRRLEEAKKAKTSATTV